MTEDGEKPDVGSDPNDDGRGSDAGSDPDEDGKASEEAGDESAAGEDEPTPVDEPGDDAVEPGRDGELGAADDEPGEPSTLGPSAPSGPDDDVGESGEPASSRGARPGDPDDDGHPSGERSQGGSPAGEPREGADATRTAAGSGRDREDRRHAEAERDRKAGDIDGVGRSSDAGESIDPSAWRADSEGSARDDGSATEEGREGPDVPEGGDVAAANEGTSQVDRAEGSGASRGETLQSGDTQPAGGEFEEVDEVDGAGGSDVAAEPDVPEDVRSYDRFQKVDRASYDRVNEFLRDRTYVTAREWAIARLCADFRTATGVEMTKIGENLPHLVPFMTDTYSPQAVNQARSAFEDKVRTSGATFLYGAMSGFFTADELDDIMYEVTEVAKFLLEVEGVELTVDEELDAEDRISAVMREVRQASEELRYDEVACPHCGEAFQPAED